MELSWLENLLQNKRTLWIVGALAILLFLVTNLPWQLDDYDQAKQAFTSLEMIIKGHWLYQHTPQERLATKPPLVGWVSAGLYQKPRTLRDFFSVRVEISNRDQVFFFRL